MKSGLHPEYIATKVHCNGCNTTFESTSTVPEISVEICSNCHPFYTGKQKLVDTAGRVDRFNALRDKAAKRKADSKPKAERKSNAPADEAIEQIEEEFEAETVELPQAEAVEAAEPTADTETTES